MAGASLSMPRMKPTPSPKARATHHTRLPACGVFLLMAIFAWPSLEASTQSPHAFKTFFIDDAIRTEFKEGAVARPVTGINSVKSAVNHQVIELAATN